MAIKPLCIVDTSALMNLQEIECQNAPLYKLLWKEFDIRISADVNHEIARHRTQGMPQEVECLNKVHHINHIDRLEERLIGRNPSSKNKGERRNICVAFNLFENQLKHAVFLTDDLAARRGFVDEFFAIFQIGRVWSSLDLILYLFLRQHGVFPVAAAESALRDVNAQIARNQNPQTNPTKTEERVKVFAEYTKRIRKLNEVLTRLKRQ
jgi:hypothetical protein